MAKASYGGRPAVPGRTRCANGSNTDQSICRSISSSFLFDPSRASANALAKPICLLIRRSSQCDDGITESRSFQEEFRRGILARGRTGEGLLGNDFPARLHLLRSVI